MVSGPVVVVGRVHSERGCGLLVAGGLVAGSYRLLFVARMGVVLDLFGVISAGDGRKLGLA